MIDHHRSVETNLLSAPGLYQVRVGHATVTVRVATRREAVSEAKKMLCREMPNLWDVIHDLEDDRFEIIPVTS